MGNLRFQAIHNFQYRPMQQFFSQMGLLKVEVDRWEKQQQTVVFLVSDSERAKNWNKIFVITPFTQYKPQQIDFYRSNADRCRNTAKRV